MQEHLRQVAGVQVTPYSGVPGAPMVVRIRGAANLANVVHPLYVVDGVPQFQRTDEEYGPQFSGLNPLLSIPAEEIETIEVLKGAYETALYGQQGTDGVIRITTRRGRNPGKPLLQYQGYGGVQTIRNRYELLNAQEYAQLANETALTEGRIPPYSATQVAGFGRGTDWQREITRPAALQSHHLSLQGHPDSTGYYVAANYLNQQGIVENSYLKRYGLRATLTQDLGGRLRLEAGGSFQQLEQQYSPFASRAALYARPTVPVRDANGEFTTTSGPVDMRNPVQLTKQDYQQLRQTVALARVRALWRIGGGFALDVPVSLEITRQQFVQQRLHFDPSIKGSRTEQTNRFQQVALLPTLRYAHTWGQHQVQASLGIQGQNFKYRSDTRTELPPYLATSGMRAESSLRAAQATAQYVFAGRYEARATLRRDASSRFAPNDRWELQPGAQLRWHAAEESFLKEGGRVQTLDVWAGWSRVRPDGFSLTTNITGGGSLFYQQQQQHVDAGLCLVAGGFDVTVEAYQRRTMLLFNPGLTGSSTSVNTAVRSQGLELTVGHSWRWGAVAASTRLAGSLNHSRFQSEYLQFTLPTGSATLDGHSLGGWRGPTYLGVDPATGAARFRDTDDNGYPDLDYLGSGLPKQLLSLSQRASYRRFSLELQADAMLGHYVNNVPLRFLDVADVGGNSSTRLLDRWTPDNPNAAVPGAGQRVLPALSSYTLQPGNHVRLTALTARYKLWEQDRRSLALWLGAHNLLVLSKYRGYDPNISSAGADARQAGLDDATYPTARTILLGVQATL
ncbi:TonB-dependent receptor plug domain-containing protein [Hymenobacter sp. J193]|uniref:TonB-dependent receptor plug domain-containing protein n=1 Tax=Hymenobacter sp. J193 TaxID=2898429 RepID=UPI002151D025|nr:TonB-dependent receptor plug domain-containing protein [Hymenobacter sp. J193]MCR5888461.1 TonB-dependent receptor plug domain-containing protein [Hymenobacter sp. J193]